MLKSFGKNLRQPDTVCRRESNSGSRACCFTGLRDPRFSKATTGNISADDFASNGVRSPHAVAFISPHVDFSRVTSSLQRMAGTTPLIAVSTSGELGCASSGPLYKPTGQSWSSVIVQSFPPISSLPSAFIVFPCTTTTSAKARRRSRMKRASMRSRARCRR
jgi:hypothetical protein